MFLKIEVQMEKHAEYYKGLNLDSIQILFRLCLKLCRFDLNLFGLFVLYSKSMRIYEMCLEYLQWWFFLVLVLMVSATVLQALCQVLVLVLCLMLQKKN